MTLRGRFYLPRYFKCTFSSYIRLDTDNVLLPCSINLKPFTADGVHFQVYVCLKEKRVLDSSEVALVDPVTLNVLGATRKVYNYLNKLLTRNLGDAADQLRGIEEIVPDYHQVRETWLQATSPLFAEDSEAGRHERSLGLQQARVRVESVQLHGPDSPHIDKLVFTFKKSEEKFYLGTEAPGLLGVDEMLPASETDYSDYASFQTLPEMLPGASRQPSTGAEKRLEAASVSLPDALPAPRTPTASTVEEIGGGVLTPISASQGSFARPRMLQTIESGDEVEGDDGEQTINSQNRLAVRFSGEEDVDTLNEAATPGSPGSPFTRRISVVKGSLKRAGQSGASEVAPSQVE